MSMSKKDFVALGTMCKESLGQSEMSTAAIIRIADFCQKQNPQFMRERWLDFVAGNCGPNGGAIKQGAR